MNDINRKFPTRGQRKNRQNRGADRPRRSRRDDLIEESRLSKSRIQTMKFTRTVNQNFNMTPTTGFNGVASDMEIAFSLNATNFYLGGVLASSASNPGASDFLALYDEYKIDQVEVALMYGGNSVTPGVPGTIQLPILLVVFDATDTSATSLSSMLQYQNLNVVQLGNNRNSSGYTFKCAPRAQTTVGGSAVAGSSVTWINIDTPSVNHLGVKVFYDSAGSTLASIAGTLQVYVKYHLSMRSSR